MANEVATWTAQSTIDGTRGGERIDQLLRARAIEDYPTYRAIFERHYERNAEINGSLFVEPEKQRQRDAVLAETRAALQAELDGMIRTRERQFEQAEGEARRAARGEDWANATDAQIRREQALTAEWALRLAGIATETNIAALQTLAADAELTDNPRIMRAVLDAVTKQTGRLAAMEREDTKGGPDGPVQLAHVALEQKFREWWQRNPTPAERLRAAADGRQRARMDIERNAALYRQLFGLA